MTTRPWYEDFFGDDYLRMYTPFLPAKRTAREVEEMLRLLNLPERSAVLDLCCGYGRHTLDLAQRGYQMVGQDLSPTLLHYAQEEAEKQHLSVHWVQKDMRTIPFEHTFDAVINVFTSFGYLESEEDDQRVLQQVQKALKPGGLFLLETLSHLRVLRSFTPHGIIHYNDGTLVLEDRRIDLRTSRNEVQITIIPPEGERVQYTQSIRIYTLTELAQMLMKAGLELEAYYGGLDGSTYTLESNRLVIVCQKAS